MSKGIAYIREAIQRLEASMIKDDFRGYDPYDALTSPLTRLPVLRSSHRLRFFLQQAVKRAPLNCRPLLGISKGENPVTLALAIQAYTELDKAEPDANHISKIQPLLKRLQGRRSPGFTHACWGYEFPWEARYAYIGAEQPTIVATGIITNALFRYWQHNGDTEAKQLVISACSFAESSLKRTYDENEDFLFSYSPFDRECVINASMKATRLLSQGYHITGQQAWKVLAEKSANRVAGLQRSDGAWQYSLRATGGRVDNYHTGYVLDCLEEHLRLTGNDIHDGVLKKGYNYYRNRFIGQDGQPFFYDNSRWPADCTSGGQALLTLTRFGDIAAAEKTAEWMIRNMQSPAGFFYYRKHVGRTDRTHYMRWSDAWMLAGLTAVHTALKKDAG